MKSHLTLLNGGPVISKHPQRLENRIVFYFIKMFLIEWERSLVGNPNVTGTAQCVILRNRFKYRSRCSSLPYFYWTLSECDTAAAGLCKKKQVNLHFKLSFYVMISLFKLP